MNELIDELVKNSPWVKWVFSGIGISIFIVIVNVASKLFNPKRNLCAEWKIIKYAKMLESQSNRVNSFAIDEISELLNLPEGEAREILTRSPKIKKLKTRQELWVRKKVYKEEEDINYGENLL